MKTSKLKKIIYGIGISLFFSQGFFASLPDRHEPDEGEINYPWLYALLDKTGYDGWIGCEYIPRTDTLSGLGWFSPYRKK